MSPTVLRWTAVPLGLLAFALRVTGDLWFRPLTWHLTFWAGELASAAGLLVAIGLPAGIFLMIFGWSRRRPVRFDRVDGAFIVPASPAFAGSQAILWMFISGGLVMTERVPNGDTMRLAQMSGEPQFSIIMVGLGWAVAAAFLLVRRPRLRLDPEGMTIQRLRRRTRVAWDDLLPGGPLPPAKSRSNQLTIYRNAPPVFGGYPPSENIPVAWLHVDVGFLANAIRHYVEHPADRAAIGTAEELVRLDVGSEVAEAGGPVAAVRD